jgi:phage anti-repressor protein
MNNQLINVFNGNISDESVLLCNARDLHEFLGAGKHFASWITERIAEYEFEENQDYILLPNSGKQRTGRGGYNRKEYHITLDTAKELAMVERNDKGRLVRRYFIECEKKLHGRSLQPVINPIKRQPPKYRYIVSMTVEDFVTGQTETFRGGANTPDEIVTGTANRFGMHIFDMVPVPINAF